MFPLLFFQKVPEKILDTIKESVSESEGFYNRIKQIYRRQVQKIDNFGHPIRI